MLNPETPYADMLRHAQRWQASMRAAVCRSMHRDYMTLARVYLAQANMRSAHNALNRAACARMLYCYFKS
jgi:hypothetical protein